MTQEIISPFLDDDGGERSYYINGESRLYSAIRFRGRAMTYEERSAYNARIENLDEEMASKLMLEELASRVVSWEFPGFELPSRLKNPTYDAIRVLKPQLIGLIKTIVIFGTWGGHVDPDTGSSEQPADSAEAEQRGN